MWLFTPIGFFSATLTNPSYRELSLEQQHNHIMVRARVRDDLVRLVAEHQRLEMGDRPEILALPGHDYPYRIIIPKAEWVALAARLAEMIDYSNFKNAVERKATSRSEGAARHDLYMKVWSVMLGAEKWLRTRCEDEGGWGGSQGSPGVLKRSGGILGSARGKANRKGGS